MPVVLDLVSCVPNMPKSTKSQSSDTRSAPALEPTWLTNLRDGTVSKDTETLSLTVRSVLDSIDVRSYAEIDAQLASVDVTSAAPSHVLAVLSSLFTWRDVLVEWPFLRDRAEQHFREKQLPGTENAFKGLR